LVPIYEEGAVDEDLSQLSVNAYLFAVIYQTRPCAGVRFTAVPNNARQ